jgi:hypothetical protein
MSFSEALETYLKARESYHHTFAHEDTRREAMNEMKQAGARMDALAPAKQPA